MTSIVNGRPSESHLESGGQGDRRRHLQLREIFENAYRVALPFIDPGQGWHGQAMTRHAYPALKEVFPNLTMQDLAILVPALERVFKARSASGS